MGRELSYYFLRAVNLLLRRNPKQTALKDIVTMEDILTPRKGAAQLVGSSLVGRSCLVVDAQQTNVLGGKN